MFTGIVAGTGKVKSIADQAGALGIEIKSPMSEGMKLGDSVAVDGVCLTATAIDSGCFRVQAVPETLEKTIVRSYAPGTTVNLEFPLKLGDKIHGHLVQGHVDFTGTVKKNSVLDGLSTIEITNPPSHSKYLAEKGSITINGVSLTISHLGRETFSVSLIPHTVKTTNLKSLAAGDAVNVEVDLMARYMERILENKAQETADNFLRERGAL